VSARQKAKALTLNEYADKWIGQRNVKPGTKIEYKRLKARLIKDTIGKVPLRDLHPHIGSPIMLGQLPPHRYVERLPEGVTCRG